MIDTRRPNRPDWGLEAGTVPCTVLAAVDWLPAVCVGVVRDPPKLNNPPGLSN